MRNRRIRRVIRKLLAGCSSLWVGALLLVPSAVFAASRPQDPTLIEIDDSFRPSSLSGDGLTAAGTVGYMEDSRAAIWTLGGGVQLLGDLPGGTEFSTAMGASQDGSVIVGYGSSANGEEAFLWTTEGGYQPLGDAPGGDFKSRAYGVSSDGTVVVGSVNIGIGDTPMRWTSTGGFELLNPSARGSAQAVSADGSTVVGSFINSSGDWEAFRWTPTQGFEALGDLPGGDSYSSAMDVSADGAIVAGLGTESHHPGDPGWRAPEPVRWTASGIENLGATGSWLSVGVGGMTADGSMIVGYSEYTVMYGFVWTPEAGFLDWNSPSARAEFGLDQFTIDDIWESRGVSDDGCVILFTASLPSDPGARLAYFRGAACAPIPETPALTEWGTAIFLAMLMGIAVMVLRRRAMA